MAFRLASKINRQLVRKAYRSLSAKRDTELEPIVQKADESGKVAEASPPPPPSAIASIPLQYENETDVAKKAVAIQHLQPAMLPEYYKPPIEIHSSCMYFNSANEVEKQTTMKYRKFEESKTCKNVTLPLKAPKLANPFPDPVKVMQSHTISDQEKAEQMLAEARMTKSYTDSRKAKKRPSVRSLPSNRNYSTNQQGGSKSKKCKLGEDTNKKKCVHIKLAGCAPIKSARCGKKKPPKAQCVKKEPPYPSYSETCHEDPYNRPSECKTCPYKGDEHPYFKPPKQSFHTHSLLGSKHKGECTKPSGQDKKPCAWVEQEKNKKPQQKQNKPEPKNKKKAVPRFVNDTVETSATNAQRQDNFHATKASCVAQEQKKAQKVQVGAGLSEAEQASAVSIGKEMGEWLEMLQPDDLLGNLDGAKLADEKSRCVKFPFKECTFTIVKERKERPKQGKCPQKEKRKVVEDCPQEKDDKCKKTLGVNNLRYLMTDNKEENRKKKCPKVNLGVCKDPNAEDDDPCRRKRRGKTLICPDDLLNKKPRPKKKTSPVMPFVQIRPVSKSETTVNV